MHAKASVLLAGLLWVTVCLPSPEAFQLPPCQLINQTVSLEKEGCPKCHPVETTICSGHCITKVSWWSLHDFDFSHSLYDCGFKGIHMIWIFQNDLFLLPLQDPVMKTRYVYQHVCTYRDLHYKTFELPDCPLGVDPTVTYPVAVSCNCGLCAMDTSDCTFESLQPNFCMNDIPFYY